MVYKCDYHIVWVPKYRLCVLKGDIKFLLDNDIRMLCQWKSCIVEELNVQEDHVNLLVSVPPRVWISKLMGTLKGKIAIELFKTYPNLKQKPYWGDHFWSRGYFVGTVGSGGDRIKHYVKYQEHHEWALWPFGPNPKIKATVFNGGFLTHLLFNRDVKTLKYDH